jgi:hypothetical protein
MDSVATIRQEFQDGELDHIGAVQRLEKLGYLPRDAERRVEDWTASPEVIGADGVKHPF